MYDRILVPSDGTPPVDPAVETAVDLARRHGAAIHVVHVVRADPIAGVSMESAWPGVIELGRREGETVLQTVHEHVAERDVPVDSVLLEGSPSREIVSAARDRECDLIVMATNGRDGLNRLLLGSVTERVIRHAPVPVLTIRRPATVPEDGTDADAPVSG